MSMLDLMYAPDLRGKLNLSTLKACDLCEFLIRYRGLSVSKAREICKIHTKINNSEDIEGFIVQDYTGAESWGSTREIEEYKQAHGY